MPAEESEFPENVVKLLAEHLGQLDGVEVVVERWLNPTDANGTVGIGVEEWAPGDKEMGYGSFEPTLATHTFSIQHMVKNTNAEEGHRTHRRVAKNIRLMLYRDNELQVAFRSLVDHAETRTERIQSWDVTVQRYGSNEIDSQFVYLSVTELQVQTETA